MRWYIKERHNPQLGTYYVPCGKLTMSEAIEMGEAAYGSNRMLPFDNEDDYKAELERLKVKGKVVQP